MLIELPDHVVEFMQRLASEIEGQDNRATASPYFYVVSGKREVVAPAGHGDNESHYYNAEWGEGHTLEEWKEILNEYDEENGTATDLDAFIKGCEEFGLHDVVVEENVFLTEKGCLEHMRLNGHNYRCLKDVLEKGYVKHAFRNPEMDGLHEAIMAFAKVGENAT